MYCMWYVYCLGGTAGVARAVAHRDGPGATAAPATEKAVAPVTSPPRHQPHSWPPLHQLHTPPPHHRLHHHTNISHTTTATPATSPPAAPAAVSKKAAAPQQRTHRCRCVDMACVPIAEFPAHCVLNAVLLCRDRVPKPLGHLPGSFIKTARCQGFFRLKTFLKYL